MMFSKSILFCIILLLCSILTADHAVLSSSDVKVPQIVELDSMTVVGIQSLVSMKHNVIHQLWLRLEETECEINNRSPAGVYFGISWGYKELGEKEKKETQFFHLVGAPVSSVGELPEGFTYKKIPAQKYAKFVHKGSLSKLAETYGLIFGEWLPGSGYEHDMNKCDIEWYDERFKLEGEDSEFDIYIPIKDKKD